MDLHELSDIIKNLGENLIELANDPRFNSLEHDTAKPEKSLFLKTSSLTDAHDQYFDLLRERKKGIRKGRSIGSGFAQLDELTGGFSDGELIIIGGRPGIGKTSLVLSMIMNQLKYRIPVCIYSLELTRQSITDRLVSMKKRIPVTQLRSGKLTDKEFDKVEKVFQEFSKSSLNFIEGTCHSPGEFSDMLGKLVKEKGIRVLYVDYLQLMISGHHRRNREQEISDHMRMLKSCAIEFGIPVVLVSQMNRYAEWRGGSKRPFLSDLRDSGTIEETSDKVLLIYRAETYGIPVDEEGNSTQGKAELMVAKNRLGPTGDVLLTFDRNYGLFENISWDRNVFPSLKLPDNPFNEGPF